MNAVARCWRAALSGLALAVPLLTGAFAAASELVDVELVLAVDISSSMSESELRLQREGYAAAFRSREVIEAITDGLHGRVAVTYVEWGASTSRRLVVPWTLIEDAEDAERVADMLEGAKIASLYLTSIAGAIRYGQRIFEDNEFSSKRRVIDISGDGPNNQGGLVTISRDAAVAEGVTINGLPLMVPDNVLRGNRLSLDTYYADCVIGGPRSFVMPVRDWDEFPDAVRRKLVLELAEGPVLDMSPTPMRPKLWRISTAGADCTIGEKLWRGW